MRYRGIVRQRVRSRCGAAAPAGDPARRRAGAFESRSGASRRRATRSAGRTSRNCSSRHQRLDDGQRPAPRKPQRSGRADHRRAAARDDARPHLRRGRRGRADRPAARRSARAAAGPARSTCRTQVAHGGRAFLPQVEPDRAARAGAASHGGSRRGRGARVGAPAIARRARGWRATECWSPSAPTSRPSSSCAPASAWPTRSMREWTVVYVETPELLRLSEPERNRRIDLLRLAESLGAETVTLDGPTAAAALLEYAQTRNATRVIVGAPKRRGWRALVAALDGDRARAHARRASTSSRSRRSRARTVAARRPDRETRRRRRDADPLGALLLGARAHAASARRSPSRMYPVLRAREYRRWCMCSASTIAGCGSGAGRRCSRRSLNVAAFDFFFVPPRFTFAVARRPVPRDVRGHADRGAGDRESHGERAPADARGRRARAAHGAAVCDEPRAGRDARHRRAWRASPCGTSPKCSSARPSCCCRTRRASCSYPREPPLDRSFRGADLSVAQWVVDHGRRAGLGSDTLPAAPALYVPLGDERQRLGVLAVLPANPRRVLLPEQRHLLETFAGQIGLALERARLAERRPRPRASRPRRESLRNTLLASISHDLRTPLAVIAGAAARSREHGATLDEATRASLARSIETKAREMSELVSNVLDLMRFESGQVALRRDWQTLDDLVGAALERDRGATARASASSCDLPADLPPVHVDADARSCRCSRTCSTTSRSTRRPARAIAHRGARRGRVRARRWSTTRARACRAGDPERLFDKFQRGNDEGTVVGAGLGLAICRAIVRAHGGEIAAGRPAGRRRALRVHAADDGAGAVTQAMHQILVVEDDAGIRDVLRVLLAGGALSRRRGGDRARAPRSRRAATSPTCCSSISACRTATGSTVIARVRAWSPVPIVVLSARTHGGRRRSRRSMPAPTTTSRSRSARRSCSRACARRLRRNARGAEQPSDAAASARSTIDLARRQARGSAGRHAPDAARVPRARMPGAAGRHDRHASGS